MALRPSYWEWRAELEHRVVRWRGGAVGLGVVCLLLAGLLVWMAVRPAPVYFFGQDSASVSLAGLARADRVPPDLVESFAGQVALMAGNLMPDTARRSYERLRVYLASDLQRRMAAQAAADLTAIEDQQLSTSFTIRESRVTDSSASGWTVRVTGHRTSWDGGQLLSEEDVVYIFVVTRGEPSERNPSGLEVIHLEVGRVPTSRGGEDLPSETNL
ncbi:MAG: TraE/TraK family type IV conjugative transfer system protein [Anaerolineae bacterium]